MSGRPGRSVLNYFKSVTDRLSDLRLIETPEMERWTMHEYVTSDDGKLSQILEQIAASLNSVYFPTTEELGFVDARLNSSRHNALVSGVIWIREENIGTPRVKKVGVSFHPAKCTKDVFLLHPEEWHQLLIRVFPLGKLEYGDAARMITYTIEEDAADYDLMTPEMKQAMLRVERGIESGAPQHSPISAEALGLLDPEFQRDKHVIPFRYDATARLLSVYMTNVDDDQTISLISRVTQAEVKPYYMEPEDEEAYWMLHGLARFAEQEHDEMMREELLGELK